MATTLLLRSKKRLSRQSYIRRKSIKTNVHTYAITITLLKEEEEEEEG